jgi:hypothetical protein
MGDTELEQKDKRLNKKIKEVYRFWFLCRERLRAGAEGEKNNKE